MRLRSLALVCLAATAASRARAAEIKIGVVNVREVFARYKKAEDLKRANEEKLGPRQKELERRQRELIRRAGELRRSGEEAKDLEEGYDETRRFREVKEIEHEEDLLKLDHRQFQRDVQAANERLMRKLWEDLAEASRRIGEAEGFDLVLKYYGPDRSAARRGEPVTDRELIETFQTDALLYAAPSVDITQRVLEVLENAYRRGIKLVPQTDGGGGREGERGDSPEGGRGSAPPPVRPESGHG